MERLPVLARLGRTRKDFLSSLARLSRTRKDGLPSLARLSRTRKDRLPSITGNACGVEVITTTHSGNMCLLHGEEREIKTNRSRNVNVAKTLFPR